MLEKDRKATAEFVDRFSDAVYSYLASRLFPHEDLVDDLFQQVFLEAWRGLPQWKATSSLAAWLLGIARHKVQDHYRRRLREVEMPEDAPDIVASEDDTALSFLARAEQELVEQTLGQLPESARLLLLWRYWDQHSAQQMAALTGKSLKAVERALARARSQFKTVWEQGGNRG